MRVRPARLTIACSYVKTDATSDQKLGDGKAWEGADWSHSQAKVGGMGTRLYSMWARILAAMAQGAAAKRKPKGESCWYVNATVL